MMLYYGKITFTWVTYQIIQLCLKNGYILSTHLNDKEAVTDPEQVPAASVYVECF